MTWTAGVSCSLCLFWARKITVIIWFLSLILYAKVGLNRPYSLAYLLMMNMYFSKMAFTASVWRNAMKSSAAALWAAVASGLFTRQTG